MAQTISEFVTKWLRDKSCEVDFLWRVNLEVFFIPKAKFLSVQCLPLRYFDGATLKET